MKITILAFASASEVVGKKLELELPAGARLSDLRGVLEKRFPAIAPMWPRLAVAVGGALVQGDPELAEGTEVALLPPVSGGAAGARTALSDGPLDLAAAEWRVAGPGRGAVLLFVGNVRDHHRGRAVSKLTYSAYRAMAETSLERIATELEEGAEELRVAIVHRLGEVAAGEASVVIAVASPHRQAAYEASRTALERLKREVPIWKREHYVGGAAEWREEEPLRVELAQPGASTANRR